MIPLVVLLKAIGICSVLEYNISRAVFAYMEFVKRLDGENRSCCSICDVFA